MSPDSIETRVGVLGERISQVQQATQLRLKEHDEALTRLASIVADHEVLKDRFGNAREDSAEYRRQTSQALASLQKTMQAHHDHFTKKFEELEDRDEKRDADRASRGRALWLSLAGLLIACAGSVATVIAVAQGGH